MQTSTRWLYDGCMNEEQRTVQMNLVNPGTTAPDGDFTFEMQPRWNASRTVKYALTPKDAETLQKQLTAFLKDAQR